MRNLKSLILFSLVFLSWSLVAADASWLRPALRQAQQKLYKAQMERFNGTQHLVWDLSKILEDMPAGNDPSLRTYEISKVLNDGTTFFGFGLPNVFMGEVINDHDVLQVAAKSCHRAPTQNVHTQGNVQSGFFIIPKNLTQKDIERIKEIATLREGTANSTCVRANGIILNFAGFTVHGQPMNTYLLPTDLFRDTLDHGIRLDGNKIDFDIVKTVDTHISDYYAQIFAAVIKTPIRHFNRDNDTEEAKENRKQEASEIRRRNQHHLEDVKEHQAPLLDPIPRFLLSASKVSCLGKCSDRLLGAHPIYKIALDQFDIDVNDYLPETLQAFPHKNPTWSTRVKKNYLFSAPVVKRLRHMLAVDFHEVGQISDTAFLDLIVPYDQKTRNSYNIVVTSSDIFLVQNSIKYAFFDWILSKHVLVSGYSNDVRFAGELWKDADGYLHLNANSGTYMPAQSMLVNALTYASLAFPFFRFIEEQGPPPESP